MSFSGEFYCELEATCGGVKEISRIEPSVSNLESGVIWSICDVGDLAGTGEDDGGMSGTTEGGSTSKSVSYS
jgi:hypothetical protein